MYGLCSCASTQGGSGDFIKILQPDPRFSARVWRRIARLWSKSLAFSVRILGFPLRFSVLRSVLLGWPKKFSAKVFLRDHGWRAPPPHTLHAIAARQNPAQSRMDGLRGPCFAVDPRGTSPTSPALGAKVWRKVWGKSLDFESLEQSLSFLYEISRTPLPR
jgi:hypothetical protein